MNQQKNWGIVGLGWLGQALSTYLSHQQVKSWGTHRDQFDWNTDEFPQTSCDILVLNTPPLLTIPPQVFVEKIPSHAGQRIIFISSISVYGNQEGVITESTIPVPITERGKWLYSVEQLLLAKFPEQAVIIRPGGLIGGSRHPVVQLSSGQQPCSANTPINLIHREDLIRIICMTAELERTPQIIHAVAPYHPCKMDYYSAWTRKLGLRDLNFRNTDEPHKTLRSDFLPQLYPNWLHPLLDTL